MDVSREGLKECWLTFQQARGCSIDRMVCSPALRIAYLDSVRTTLGSAPEEDVLWLTMCLRKKKALPKTQRS